MAQVKERTQAKARKTPAPKQLEKTPTGIQGFDEISMGGIPKGRPTLITGRPGCGKTLFAMEFLARGALQFGEPGVLMSFEENAEDLIINSASLGFEIPKLIENKMLAIDFVSVERREIEETGEYDLEGLFVRLDYAIRSVNAKRVVLDTIEALFGGLQNETILRAELRRLFFWLKSRGVTAIVTGERGKETLTRHGLEEYVADCVILLEHTVNDNLATRRLRIVKYRGSIHGTDEYPFLIDEKGISVLPLTSLTLEHPISSERIPSGVDRLDAMLEGKGFFKGSSILISGTPGTGKSTLAAYIAEAACNRGEKVLYFAFEEAPAQIIRNMHSVGLNLDTCRRKGNLRIQAQRPTAWGLERHLALMHKVLAEFKPDVVIVDPISNLISAGAVSEVRSMLVRLVSLLKERQTTSVYTNLVTAGESTEMTEVGISSLMDTWILLRDIELNGERNRGIYVLKSRGMEHSNQIREFRITSDGIDIIDVYAGPEGVLTGTARLAQEATETANRLVRLQEIDRLQREIDRKTQLLDSQMAILKTQFEAERDALQRTIEQEKLREDLIDRNRLVMARVRKKGREEG